MGTGFPMSIRVAKVVFYQLIILSGDILHEFGMDITYRCEAIELVDCLGIKLDRPASVVYKKRVLACPVRIEFPHDGGIGMDRL